MNIFESFNFIFYDIKNNLLNIRVHNLEVIGPQHSTNPVTILKSTFLKFTYFKNIDFDSNLTVILTTKRLSFFYTE